MLNMHTEALEGIPYILKNSNPPGSLSTGNAEIGEERTHSLSNSTENGTSAPRARTSAPRLPERPENSSKAHSTLQRVSRTLPAGFGQHSHPLLVGSAQYHGQPPSSAAPQPSPMLHTTQGKERG